MIDAAPLPPAHILLVEDEPELRDDIAEELRASHYLVTACGNGEQALTILAAQCPDLILCDISMPVMDGYSLLEALRAQRPDLAGIPFIFLTAQASATQMSQGKRAGADDYLAKPIDFDLLLATIEARLRQLRRLKLLHPVDRPLPDAATAVPRLDSMQVILDSLTVSLVMFAGNGLLSFVNRMAASSFNLHVGDSLSDFARAVGIRETEQLCRSIQQMMNTPEESIRCLALSRTDAGVQNLLATLCSLEKPAAPAHDSGLPNVARYAPAVSVILSSMPGQRLQPPLDLLNDLYDLTPAEARVAWAFTQGKRSDEIAAEFQISPTTVAFHKRNIFLKTQTHRQADLIALLLSLPLL